MRTYINVPELRIRRYGWSAFAFVQILVVIIIWLDKSNYYLSNPEDGNLLIAFGRLTGLLGELALLMELVLIGRITHIEQAYGFDRMNKLHRWIGYSILIFLLAHPLFLSLGNAVKNEMSVLDQFINFISTTRDVFPAFVSVLLIAFVVAISVPITRKKIRYEVWYFAHFLTYLAIGLAFQHQINSGDVSKTTPLYYWLVLNFGIFGIMLAYRFVIPLWNSFHHKFRVAAVTMESKDVCSVYLTGVAIEDFKFKAGQYCNLTFLAKGMWYTHPFSFSAEPNGKYIRFTIKALGDFTKMIPQLVEGTRVIVDGPLGTFIEARASRQKLLLIGGGIGITPLRALLGDIVQEKKRDVILLIGARTVDDLVFVKELEALQAIYPFQIRIVLSTPTPGYESGFIDKEKLVRLVPDFFDREVFLCGPPPMMAATVANLKDLGLQGEFVHYENFAF